jgi:hypothetical protein
MFMVDMRNECRKAMFWEIYWKARAYLQAPKETNFKLLLNEFTIAPAPCYAG